MIPCQNRRSGCPGLFHKVYGMQIHLRSCIYKGRSSFKKKNRISISSTDLYHIERRLRSDVETFNTIHEMELASDEYDDVFHTLSQDVLMIDNLNSVSNDLLSADQRRSSATDLMLKLAKLCRKAGKTHVNDIISILSSTEFSMKDFRDKCKRSEDCLYYEQNVTNLKLKGLGFRLVTISDSETGVQGDLYTRSVVDLLRKQIAGSCNRSAVFSPPLSQKEEYCHPMIAKLGTECVPAVQKHIMESISKEDTWRTKEKCGEQSFVGMVQLYSDKTCTSLKASALQFYPLHITLLNFSEDHRRKCISNGETNIAFLPVSFYRIAEGVRVKQSINRSQRLRMLHLSISFVLKELRTTAYKGFSCLDRQRTSRVCHPCLVSYCCDLPEGKDLTSVRNGNSSNRNCHRCQVLTNDFSKYSQSQPRNGKEECLTIFKAQKLIKKGKRAESYELLHDQSLVAQISCLSELPFQGLHPMLDYHALFSFEPLHNFHLGISKDLKRCLSERLRSSDLMSGALPTRGGMNRIASFKTIRRTVLSGINNMLCHIEKSSPASNLRIDFSNSTKGSNGNGLYVEDGKLVGMLEAKDYRCIDMVSPFIGMFADRCCDEVSTAVTTELFVSYVEIMQISLSYNNCLLWNEEKVRDLERRIEAFKAKSVSLYGSHHVSELCTEKFHQLDHLGEDIRKFGGLRYGDSGLYESTHTDVKRAYRSSSRKKSSVMKETVDAFVKDKHSKSLGDDLNTSKGSVNAVRKSTRAKQLSLFDDCASAINTGKGFVLGELSHGRNLLRKIRIAKEQMKYDVIVQLEKKLSSVSGVVRELLNDVEETGARILYDELRDVKMKEVEGIQMSDRCKVIRVSSAYVPGIMPPSADNVDKRTGEIRVQQCDLRIPQRIVATRGFYRSPNMRQDSVLIEAETTGDPTQINLWVAKVLCIIRVPIRSISEGPSHASELELAFVQFYDVKLPEDEIDNALRCIKLQWARGYQNGALGRNEDNENISESKWYSLLPVSSIRGVVHVLRGDYGIEGRGTTADMDSVPWEQEVFYINRFYFNSSSTIYNHKA